MERNKRECVMYQLDCNHICEKGKKKVKWYRLSESFSLDEIIRIKGLSMNKQLAISMYACNQVYKEIMNNVKKFDPPLCVTPSGNLRLPGGRLASKSKTEFKRSPNKQENLTRSGRVRNRNQIKTKRIVNKDAGKI